MRPTLLIAPRHMIVTCEQMKVAEEAIFATGVEAETLMEHAGQECAKAILESFPKERAQAILYVGKGHNGGDALVIGRCLRDCGWSVEVRLGAARPDLAELTAKKLAEFEGRHNKTLRFPEKLVLIDGLLGIGAKGALRGYYLELAAEMAKLRREKNAYCYAVDIPSGVNGDSGEVYEGAVTADCTLAIGLMKAGLLADQAIDQVGRLALIEFANPVEAKGDASQKAFHSGELADLIPPRPFSMHKGNAGRVGIVAGSRGLTGAAQLSSLGALHAGGGLVTLFVREEIYPILATRVPPEVMVHPIRSLNEVRDFNLDAIGIGPGLGSEHEEETLGFILEDERPMVVDADALNMLSRIGPRALDQLVNAAPRLLTPHPGELQRLFPESKELSSRVEIARTFVERWPVTLLYKGARTLVAEHQQPIGYNTTGHPALATGGVGDVLTGMCSAFLARGISPYHAAALGSWLVGRSGELNARNWIGSPEAVTASKVIQGLPRAFDSLRRRQF